MASEDLRHALVDALRKEQGGPTTAADGDQRPRVRVSRDSSGDVGQQQPLGHVRRPTFLDRLSQISASITAGYEQRRPIDQYVPRSSVAKHNARARGSVSAAHRRHHTGSSDSPVAGRDMAMATAALTHPTGRRGSVLGNVGAGLQVPEETQVWGRHKDVEASLGTQSAQLTQVKGGIALDQDGYFLFDKSRPHLKFQLQSLLLGFDAGTGNQNKGQEARRRAVEQRWHRKRQMYQTAVSGRERSRRLAREATADEPQQQRQQQQQHTQTQPKTQTRTQRESSRRHHQRAPLTERSPRVPPLSLGSLEHPVRYQSQTVRAPEPPQRERLTALDYTYGDYSDKSFAVSSHRGNHNATAQQRTVIAPTTPYRHGHTHGLSARRAAKVPKHKLHLAELDQAPLTERLRARTEVPPFSERTNRQVNVVGALENQSPAMFLLT